MSRANGHFHTGRELSVWNGSEIALKIKPKISEISAANSNDLEASFGNLGILRVFILFFGNFRNIFHFVAGNPNIHVPFASKNSPKFKPEYLAELEVHTILDNKLVLCFFREISVRRFSSAVQRD